MGEHSNQSNNSATSHVKDSRQKKKREKKRQKPSEAGQAPNPGWLRILTLEKKRLN
jgi:hypothetical protein